MLRSPMHQTLCNKDPGGAAPEIQCIRLQKDLSGPSPLIVQQGEEFPFRVELGGSAELRYHLARDASG